jgi:hypothetical protein
MAKPNGKQTKRGPSLGKKLMNTFFPARYAPPPSRVPTQLIGWSGLATDPPMPHDPYAWGRGPAA